jgi:hypothetical protein
MRIPEGGEFSFLKGILNRVMGFRELTDSLPAGEERETGRRIFRVMT